MGAVYQGGECADYGQSSGDGRGSRRRADNLWWGRWGYFIEEMRRGSVGTMPFCSQPEAFVAIWDLCQAGDEKAAFARFYRELVPISRISGQSTGLFYAVHKQLLVHRGIIRTATVRSPAPPVDPLIQQELAALLDELYPQS
ncbi:MAG: hypothetical protein R2932_11215 [Caldilineaceae bacterium]